MISCSRYELLPGQSRAGQGRALPASIFVEPDCKVGDSSPQQGLPDGQGQIQDGLGQRKAPSREELHARDAHQVMLLLPSVYN